MGSGSSKSSSKKPAAEKKRPVANVNKDDRILPQEIKHPPPPETVKNEDIRTIQKPSGSHFDQQPDLNENKKNGKPNKKKMKVEPPSYNDSRHDSGLVFEDDSDMDNDIDEVLKIPMAIEYPKSKKDKNKNDQRGRELQRENHFNNNSERDNSIGRRDENLPETYAQRLQRQQYKLQQDMLIRQKTLYRNPNEWDNTYDDEQDAKPQGFDASRFRQANQKVGGRKELFTTNDNDELMTPRYMQTSQNLDEVQISQRAESPERKAPSYNQSELDLMAELERDLL